MTSPTPPPPPPGDGGAGRHLWVDAGAGIAGDMLLGALVDAGADLARVQEMVDAVLPATLRLESSTVTRAGLRALHVQVHLLVEDQPQRTWSDIRDLLADAPVPEPVRDAATAVFSLLAEAEARVHGVAVEDVHFHEVGAWDSVADVVGVAAAVHLLGAEEVSAGPVSLGSGRVRTAHGELPVPAPATMHLATGWQVRAGGDGELATPTGMALLRGLAHRCTDLPALHVDAIGVGAGTRDVPGRANVVRVVLGSPAKPAAQELDGEATAAAGEQELAVLEANVDDLDPRVWPTVLDALLEAGAADAWLTPVLMKKGRPAHTLSVLCAPASRTALRELVLSLTTTFGVREHRVWRTALGRTFRPVPVRGATVQVKISTDGQGRVRHATPELEDALRASRAAGLPLRQVLDEAATAAANAGIVPGALLAGADSDSDNDAGHRSDDRG